MTRTRFRLTDWLILIGLGAAMLLTRVGHFGSAFAPPDASLAVFFLAGLWLRGLVALPVLIGMAALSDWLAVQGGTSGWCITPAYAFLVPTYGALWLAGRLQRAVNWRRPTEFLRGALYLLGATLAAFVISSGSFFLFSGYFAAMSGGEYWRAVSVYVPYYVGWSCGYALATIAIVEALSRLAAQRVGGNAGERAALRDGNA